MRNSFHITRIADSILRTAADDYQYIHDPEHRNKPHGTFWETEKGWSNDPKDDPKNKQTGEYPYKLTQLDNEYFEAIKANDHERIQKMVDDRARSAGYNIPDMFHGTTHEFNVFDNKGSNIQGAWGKGFYFTNTKADAKINYAGIGRDLHNRIKKFVKTNVWNKDLRDLFAKRIDEGKISKDCDFEDFLYSVSKDHLVGNKKRTLTVSLSVKNPAIIDEKGGTFLDFKDDDDSEDHGSLFKFAKSFLKFSKQYSDDEKNISEALYRVIIKHRHGGGYLKDIISDIKLEDSLTHILPPESLLSNDEDIVTNEIIRQSLMEIGYDGILDNLVYEKYGIKKKNRLPMRGIKTNTKHLIVFNSEQIKLKYATTKDDSGNIIPLSQRFNPKSKDTRY